MNGCSHGLLTNNYKNSCVFVSFFTWVVVTENKRGYISCGSVQVEGTSTWLFKENKGGYIPCGSFLVKDFTRLKRNL